MFKSIFKVIKRVIISSFLLYAYNVLVQPLNMSIPINIITVLVISLLGIPSLLGLIFILVFIY